MIHIDRPRTAHVTTSRSTEMILIHEALARAHSQDRMAEAELERVARRLVAARRRERRAERAAQRASRLARLASASLARAV
jgi:regulator of sirC expression with transglutaminase-like and TPR domain